MATDWLPLITMEVGGAVGNTGYQPISQMRNLKVKEAKLCEGLVRTKAEYLRNPFLTSAHNHMLN